MINIRFLFWHFKVEKQTWKISLSFNPHHWSHKPYAVKKPFEVYEWNFK